VCAATWSVHGAAASRRDPGRFEVKMPDPGKKVARLCSEGQTDRRPSAPHAVLHDIDIDRGRRDGRDLHIPRSVLFLEVIHVASA
jgi:hypothetical protein